MIQQFHFWVFIQRKQSLSWKDKSTAYVHCRLPGWLSGKESACQVGDTGSIPGLGKSPGEGWQPTPLFLLGKSHGQRILVGYSPWGCKRVRQDLAPKLEKSVAPHSSILTWKIPWAEEPGRLQPTGSHRVGQNWGDLAAAAAASPKQQQWIVW